MGLCCAGGVSGAEGSGFCTAPVSAGAAVGFLRSAGVGPVLLVHSSWAGRASLVWDQHRLPVFHMHMNTRAHQPQHWQETGTQAGEMEAETPLHCTLLLSPTHQRRLSPHPVPVSTVTWKFNSKHLG